MKFYYTILEIRGCDCQRPSHEGGSYWYRQGHYIDESNDGFFRRFSG